MTASRAGLLAGLMISLPVVFWSAGILAEAERFYDFAPKLLSPGLKAMLAAQAVILTVLVPWSSLRFSLNETIAGLATFVLVPLPLICIFWLMNIVHNFILKRGIFIIIFEAFLVLAISKAIFYMTPSLLARMMAGAGMQALFGTVVFALRDRWLAWVGL